jgi:hypothetical protein
MCLLPARAGLAMGVAALKPFLLRFLKTCAARTLLLAIVTFATLLFSGCENGDFIYTAGRQQNTLSKPNARDQSDPYPSYFVDWTKPAKDQPGETYPTYEGIGTP